LQTRNFRNRAGHFLRNFAEVYTELMPRDSFIHLHLHSEYSLLDGANRILSGGQNIQEVLERAASKAAS